MMMTEQKSYGLIVQILCIIVKITIIAAMAKGRNQMNEEHYFLRPPIIISEEELKRQKRDPKLLIEKFERLRRCELNSGKSESHPDVMKLSETIEKLRKEVNHDRLAIITFRLFFRHTARLLALFRSGGKQRPAKAAHHL